MGKMGEIDANMQDLVRTFTNGDGHDLMHAQETGDGDAWAQNCGAVFEDLRGQGWLTPTEAEIVRQQLQRIDDTAGVGVDTDALDRAFALVTPAPVEVQA